MGIQKLFDDMVSSSRVVLCIDAVTSVRLNVRLKIPRSKVREILRHSCWDGIKLRV